eukprot:TRINITY_DN51448_c0_g1_i2.p4 TRINITY_DN51448_c0_g1~~TRINITY_DN51448_c0_g1_i2.p4  ORF type:complete len:123 (-),score=48.52 TRINITY_DN51448_c0_g1_i2:380-748(-)
MDLPAKNLVLAVVFLSLSGYYNLMKQQATESPLQGLSLTSAQGKAPPQPTGHAVAEAPPASVVGGGGGGAGGVAEKAAPPKPKAAPQRNWAEPDPNELEEDEDDTGKTPGKKSADDDGKAAV